LTVPRQPEAARKKQLGQYFTGQRVGRLLAALAGADTAKTIIDPMVGSADLLVSCLQVGATPDRMIGVELDPLALAQAEVALRGVTQAQLVQGNAFATELPDGQFDLVITNPPYVRYQSRADVPGLSVPSSEAVRLDLLGAIRSRSDLSDVDQSLLVHAARTYPGTADIAVPAWILCASLVCDGGVLAVVVPQAWLSRNYAHAVRELLDEAFDVEVVVEDGEATWFADAQVRTHLVVARKRAATGRRPPTSVVVARATSALDTNGSLLGSFRTETALARAIRKVTSAHPVDVTRGLVVHVERDRSMAASGHAGHIAGRVVTALGVDPGTIVTKTLDSYGWRAGQGLRTGANDFFYVRVDNGRVQPAARWGKGSLAIPPECLMPAVRRQSDLTDELAIENGRELSSRILNLRGWATATDRKRMDPGAQVRVLPSDVAKWIDQVAATPLYDREPTKLFPELAAVAPNIRADRAGRSTGFWYQLPELAPRHVPQLFVARVCGAQPTAYANPAGAVVDANFSTLWPTTSDALPAEALLALLHSSWVWANLEASCTVLGGGALKVEATDLRRLPLPQLNDDDIASLVVLGRGLLKGRTDELADAIDQAVASSLLPEPRAGGDISVLRKFAVGALEDRSRR
jgi:predicted RNA methylase